MSTEVIRKFRAGRFIFTAGLRRDGKSTLSLASDWRDGGTVVLAVITPLVIVVVFDAPRLDALADEADELEALHPEAWLTGGKTPAHVPGAYPRLSCCGGPVTLVETTCCGDTLVVEA